MTDHDMHDQKLLQHMLQKRSGRITLEPRDHPVYCVPLIGDYGDLTIDLNGGTISAIASERIDNELRNGLLQVQHGFNWYDPANGFKATPITPGRIKRLRIVNGTFDGKYTPATRYHDANEPDATQKGLRASGFVILNKGPSDRVDRLELSDLTFKNMGRSGVNVSNVQKLVIENCRFDQILQHPVAAQQNFVPTDADYEHIWRDCITTDCDSGGDWTSNTKDQPLGTNFVKVLWQRLHRIDTFGQTKTHGSHFGMNIEDCQWILRNDANVNMYPAFVQRNDLLHYLAFNRCTFINYNNSAIHPRQSQGATAVRDCNFINCVYGFWNRYSAPYTLENSYRFNTHMLDAGINQGFDATDYWTQRIRALNARRIADGYPNYMNAWPGGKLKP